MNRHGEPDEHDQLLRAEWDFYNQPAARCDAWPDKGGCVLPIGHNRGQADIPSNHQFTADKAKAATRAGEQAVIDAAMSLWRATQDVEGFADDDPRLDELTDALYVACAAVDRLAPPGPKEATP